MANIRPRYLRPLPSPRQRFAHWSPNCTVNGGRLLLATPQAALVKPASPPSSRAQTRPRLDGLFLAGITIAFAATLIGIASTGVSLAYFFQPTGAVIVLGGTLGVILITTPGQALMHSARRVKDLFAASDADSQALIEQIVECARARRRGLVALEPLIPGIRDEFLKKGLLLTADLTDREELKSILETDLRMAERQGEADAKTLEVAGGFAPTIGIIGTVVGLIDVLRHFANLQAVGYGIGTAFVSTIYGLTLANLVLLPAAHRIRARVAANFETQELILEGILAIMDTVHPSIIRMRLNAFVRQPIQGAKPHAA
jgi:chemotaxis protein MotA